MSHLSWHGGQTPVITLEQAAAYLHISKSFRVGRADNRLPINEVANSGKTATQVCGSIAAPTGLQRL
jgi:hypothetical protein